MKGLDYYFSTASQIRNKISDDRRFGESSKATVREVARLLRERHPELCEPPWTPVAEGLPEERGRYEVTRRTPYGVKVDVLDLMLLPVGLPELERTWLLGQHSVMEQNILAWRPAPPPWDGGGA